MYRVLLVDDDSLVRQGLRMTIPWGKFNMEVIGEAKNGKKALEFMEEHEVDLLITDLAMPIMSGIDLIQIVKVQYPNTAIVVLTLHQDFEYIQEVLRAGVIDYIAKVQLEDDDNEQIFARIAERMRKESIHSDRKLKLESQQLSGEKDVLVVWQSENVAKSFVKQIATEYVTVNLNQHLAWIETSDHIEKLLEMFKECMKALPPHDEHLNLKFIHITNIPKVTLQDFCQWFENFMQTEAFYLEQQQVHHFSYNEIIDKPYSLQELLQALRSLCWCFEEQQVNEQLRLLYNNRLSADEFKQFLIMLYAEWNQYYYSVTRQHLKSVAYIKNWHEFKVWLKHVLHSFQTEFRKSPFSQEVQQSIGKAIELVHANYASDINVNEVSTAVHMSRSYFSQCFKEISGYTFNEYVRKIRIEQATYFLLHTNYTIQYISEKVGYSDEKYFSQIFKQVKDKLPSEFRTFHNNKKLNPK